MEKKKNATKPRNPMWKGKKRRKKKEDEDQTRPNVKGKKKKKGRPPKLTEPSEKKSQKLRPLLSPWVPQCVFNYENVIGKWVLKIENI